MRQASDDEVSPTQIAALATINRDGPMTLGDLAAAEQVQPPTITAAVGRLEAQGLVKRQRATAGDRRVVHVETTPEGRKLIDRQRSRRTAYLAQRLRDLSPDELETLADATVILDRILAEDEEPEASARAERTVRRSERGSSGPARQGRGRAR
jgi:DNA-binding MarR family transcriptional regulator